MQQKHIPVLQKEVLEYLQVKPSEIYVDVTLGGAGHTRSILEQNSSCKVIGIDWDKTVIEGVGAQLKEEYPDRFFPVWGNFSKVQDLVRSAGFDKVDGILADFGTSQIQIANTPGLSVHNDLFLDMRMSAAHFKVTAYDVVNTYPEKELVDIFYQYGEESFSRKIARAIVAQRKIKPISTTKELAGLIEKIVFRKGKKIHPATKVFQALRIFVNKELENIHSFLKNAVTVLGDGGRLVCISFHSLEDRIVKHFLKDHSKKDHTDFSFSILTKSVCVASEEELSINKSARSAKLRAAIIHKYV